MTTPAEDFYEEDEPLEKIQAAFASGPKGKTQRPGSASKAAQLDAALTRLGWNDPDVGTEHQAFLYVDPALIELAFTEKCSPAEAEAAGRRRWPKSMAILVGDDDD